MKKPKLLTHTQAKTIAEIAKNLKEGEDYIIEKKKVNAYSKDDIGKLEMCVCVYKTQIWIQNYEETDKFCTKNSVFRSKDPERIAEVYNRKAQEIISTERAKNKQNEQ